MPDHINFAHLTMTDHVEIEPTKVEKIVTIKRAYLSDEITMQEAKSQVARNFDSISSQEFAVAEQYLEKVGIPDDVLQARVEELFEIFDGYLHSTPCDLPSGHPVNTYRREVHAIRQRLSEIDALIEKKFIKNQWQVIMDDLMQINTHFARKQNQVYPVLERKGFDKPSKVMWSLENDIRNQIKAANQLLHDGSDDAFIAAVSQLRQAIENMMFKEMQILYPTMLELIDDSEFVTMRAGDDDIGYCLIDTPVNYGQQHDTGDLMHDLATLLSKHGLTTQATEYLDVAQGRLTLQQINLIFKHLPVDLSFVDADDLVKFYSDTSHRIFPRSPGVIDRHVENCHPRDSVDTVKEIIRAFKNGEQDQAEFWLEMGESFVYILYTAVRDSDGKYCGVLEMMQDIGKLRQLEGSQRLLNWQRNQADAQVQLSPNDLPKFNISSQTIVGDLIEQYPVAKQILMGLSPTFKMLDNPVMFKTMGRIATLEMVAKRGKLDVDYIVNSLVKGIAENN